eukprot:CAMPEP_0170865246 /NCGR_PEP_ID=MMETSP0734-20130129/21134_1 /TAXON_ID=186038 /ORGANISM="Fragilariopsis kerguelensis, Strain L26-C5" /LENGTH=102 /DNA_ID=CAMNT_0011241359 /DNA_START=102 /DNA_END=407 /DNA_ORIENTATION=-
MMISIIPSKATTATTATTITSSITAATATARANNNVFFQQTMATTGIVTQNTMKYVKTVRGGDICDRDDGSGNNGGGNNIIYNYTTTATASGLTRGFIRLAL